MIVWGTSLGGSPLIKVLWLLSVCQVDLIGQLNNPLTIITMKKFEYIISAVIMVLMLLISLKMTAQDVKREGSTFTQVAKSGGRASGQETKTAYTYVDSKGTSYSVYLSSTGKAFIKKVNKKTGKEYKQYVPEIGRQINPEAYKNDKK